MPIRRRLVDAAFFCGVFALHTASLWAQTSDTTPPRLTGVTVLTPIVNVETLDQYARFRFTATDDLSGFNWGSIDARPTPTSSSRLAYSFRVSGNPLNGVYEADLLIPFGATPGTWQIVDIYLIDVAGNSRRYSNADLLALGFERTFQVISNKDDQPPTIVSMTLDPPLVDVRTNSVPLQFSIRTRDERTGQDFAPWPPFFSVQVASPSGRQVQYIGNDGTASCIVLNPLPVWQCDWKVSTLIYPGSERGDWTIVDVSIQDKAGNRNSYNTAKLGTSGLPSRFAVISSFEDRSPPQLTNFTFGPSVIQTSESDASLDVSISASDESGVKFEPDTPYLSYGFGAIFRSPSGNQTRTAGTFDNMFPPVGGTVQNGTWFKRVVFPRFSEQGTWSVESIILRDVHHIGTYFSKSDLQKRGFPTELVVLKPSLEPDGVLGPAGGLIADSAFGSRASIGVPGNVLSRNTSIAIDVLSSAPNIAAPRGFTYGSYFVSVIFNPSPSMPFPEPGLTLTLPLATPKLPGTKLNLFRLDPTAGIVPVYRPDGTLVEGYVLSDGVTARFTRVAHLSTFVAAEPGPTLIGDVDSNGVVDCADLKIAQLAFGKTAGQPGFDSRADLNSNRAIDLVDLAMISRQLSPSARCGQEAKNGH